MSKLEGRFYTVSQAAAAIGVSRARIHQRLTGKHAKRGTGKPLAHVDHPERAVYLIPEEAVIKWRHERILRRDPTGELLF